jgi:nicotinamide-nucleotide amidase
MSPDHQLAHEVLTLLEQHEDRIVCAESCTAGLVSATLAAIPGASRFLCGSAVVYRNATKTSWLQVPADLLSDPARGDVCHETAVRMAEGALTATPEATIAVSITGHLGPQAPEGLDGVAFIGWAWRASSSRAAGSTARQIQLTSPVPAPPREVELRVARQREAMRQVLQTVIAFYAP